MPQQCAIFRHPHSQKWSETVLFYMFACKSASRHSGVSFLDVRTSKSAPRMVCFVHFDLNKWYGAGVFVHFDFKMGFAPQRAIFHFSFDQVASHSLL